MNTQVRVGTLLLIMAGMALAPSAFAAEDARGEKIQVAILLDTSNSMDGLIGQAKGQLWKVVNELARAKRHGRHPQLEVALVEYGNDGLSEASGYIRVVSDLTTDLDLISERLFGLTTNGGQEYCGEVIDRAAEKLSWSPSADALKVMYVAGNEPFTQGGLSYKVADARAVRKGIIVNTIFCGSRDEGSATSWEDGALRTSGNYMSIDQDEAVREIRTPWDDEIIRLGNDLNATYLGYGSSGETLKSRQAAQDSNAATMGAPASVERSVAKAQAAYENDGWDLLDALQGRQVTLGDLTVDELPPVMRSMTAAQRDAYVRDLAKKRVLLQEQINAANEKRRVFIAEQLKKDSVQNTLDQAILGSAREEATGRGFTFE
jgi:hypothetical protein